MNQKALILTTFVIFLAGCASQPWSTIREDYLNAPPKTISRKAKKNALFVAEKILLESKYRNQYKIASGEVDQEPLEPEGLEYIFICFEPLQYYHEIENTLFVVVLNRHNNAPVYSGVHTKTKGNPYYRYSSLINKFQKL